MKCVLLACLLAATAAHARAEAGVATYTATAQYEVHRVRGWTVLVDPDLLADNPPLAAQALNLLDRQFQQILSVVPTPAVRKLQTVPIWLEEDEPLIVCAAYQPTAQWLAANGLNPDKAKGVVIGNALNFLAWIGGQPCMILHELAHAYHDQFVPGGFANPDVIAAYNNAMTRRLYAMVLYEDMSLRRAYAATNRYEFFAESTESFFGRNDFYPFARVDLLWYDPKTAATVVKLWSLP